MIATSFRDPSGRVLKERNKIFRFLSKKGIEDYKTISGSSCIKKYLDKGSFISYKKLSKEELSTYIESKDFNEILNSFETKKILEHEKIFFPSYPYEWSPSMLFDAGLLTIDLAIDLFKEDLGLKDASAFNILFDGSRPIFIDFLSIEKRDIKNPIWTSYNQFVKMFLIPLFLFKNNKISLKDLFFNKIDGVDVEDAILYLKGFQKLKKHAFSLITMPFFLSKKKKTEKIYKDKEYKDLSLSKFIYLSLLKKCRKKLFKLKPQNNNSSFWLNYMNSLDHYLKEDFNLKEKFILDFIREKKVSSALDIGSNTGHFSLLFARKNVKVVSIDYDQSSIDNLYLKAKEEGLNLLPLQVNISRPTPSIGWRNDEYESFLNRAENKFDVVLMLAVIHHMLITDRIPVEEIAHLASKITKEYLIIEYVDKEDIMFKKLVKGRENLYSHISLSYFKKSFSKYFQVEKEINLKSGTRTLFVLKKR